MPDAAGAEVPPYTMTLDLSVLDHLGLNLYSNIPAVLSEAVAIAWDADATTVNIVIDKDAQRISIADNSLGMDRADMDPEVPDGGIPKARPGAVKTPKYRRHVMGRKGIGKLSLFSIADRIEVQSMKRRIMALRLMPRSSARRSSPTTSSLGSFVVLVDARNRWRAPARCTSARG